MITPSKIESTSIVTEDTSVSTTPVLVYWIAASAGATGGAFQLENNASASETGDATNDKFDFTVAANTGTFFPFDPPLRFNAGLYVDVPGTNVTLTIAHSK